MNKENQILFPFTALKGRKITAVFDDPLVSSDGGLMLIREALIETGLIRSLSWPRAARNRLCTRL